MTDGPPGDPTFLFEVMRGSVRTARFAGGSVASFSERCPGKERANEDAAAAIPLGEATGLLVVADGLGGQPGADQASGLTVRRLARILDEVRAGGGDPVAAVLHGLEEANQAVEALGVGAGTTLAAALLDGSEVRSFHVGDSTVLVVDERGATKLHTIPHSPIGYALEAGLVTEEEALRHPDRHIISNMVGSPEMRVDMGASLRLERGDTLLLASDGVTDNLYRVELIELVRSGSLERAAEELADLCRSRMADESGESPSKPDDATFLIYRRD